MTSSGSPSFGAPAHSGKGGTKGNSTGSDVMQSLGEVLEGLNIEAPQTESESEGSTQNEMDSFDYSDTVMKRRQIAANALYSGAGVPIRHRELRLTNITHEKWLESWDKVRSRLGTGTILAIVGKRGTGKTQMAVQAIREMLSRGRDAMYVKALDVFIGMRSCYRDNAVTTEERLIRQYARYDLLVIDALEEKSDSEWENRMLSHIVDKRYDDVKDTILISNETPTAFADNHGSSVADRIRETGGVVQCEWDSFREHTI